MMISYIVAFSSSQRSWLTISQWRTLGHVDIGRSEKKINYRISGTCGNQKSETTKVQILKSKQTLRATWKLSADYTTMDSLNYWYGNPCAVESMYFWIDAAKFWSNFIAWTFVQWFYFIDMGIQMQLPDVFVEAPRFWSIQVLVFPQVPLTKD